MLPHVSPAFREPLLFPIEDLGSAEEILRLDQLVTHLQNWVEDNLGPAMPGTDFKPEKKGYECACEAIRTAWCNHSRTLNLRNYDLKNLPAVVGQLYHLETVDLSTNRFDTLPDALASLRKLRHLRISNNPLQSTDWRLLDKLPLESLVIDHTSLTKFPDELVNLAKRRVTIRFSSHNLDGNAHAAACRKLLRANAAEWVGFASTAEQIGLHFSRAPISHTSLTELCDPPQEKPPFAAFETLAARA
ncbi:MAG: malignant fibrous histiocytoma amplified sequence 1 [Pseudomonadota bacterium]|jgi:Leucine-rich repeat (LRR) protein